MKTRFLEKITTFPNDVWTVRYQDCLTNSIVLYVTDGITPETKAIDNCKKNWELIESISKVEGRKVLVETPTGIVDWKVSETRKFHLGNR